MGRRNNRGKKRGPKASAHGAEAGEPAAPRRLETQEASLFDQIPDADEAAWTERDDLVAADEAVRDALISEERTEDPAEGEPRPEATLEEKEARADSVVEDVATGGSPVVSEIEAWYREARTLADSGRLDEAADLYVRIIDRDPRHVRALNNLGIVYDRLGRYDEALVQYREALQQEPENVKLLSNIGAVLGTLGRYAEAESELHRALRLAPESPDVLQNLGYVQYRKGLYPAALESFRRASQLNPESATSCYYRGECANRLGHAEEAVAALERAIDLEPDNARAYRTLGILFDRMRQPDRAAEAYRRSRELLSRN